MATATSIAPTTVLVMRNAEMIRALHEDTNLRPLHRYMLSRKSASKRTDRSALQLQRETLRALCCCFGAMGAQDQPQRCFPRFPEMLAEMIGTNALPVNFS